jgi:DNA mismatch repair protein MutS
MSTEKPTVTPMMAQFMEIKASYPDALLFYRMGDFYELFFDDAVAASEALDIALTKRGKHEGSEIPMCGVPHHAAEGYLLTLIRKGFRVAVCEQMESPAEAKKRGAKSVMRREVIRLVTPGTLTEESLLDARRHNYLAAYADVRGDGALAWADMSTGAFHVMPLASVRLSPELARLAPSEVVLSDTSSPETYDLVTESGAAISPLSPGAFDSTQGAKRICDVFQIASLDAFGEFTRPEISAMNALIEYLEITQKGKLPLLRPPQKESSGGTMQIDAATRRNLELTASLNGGRAGSLLSVIDRSVTAGGGRLLERRLSSPSRDIATIHSRLAAVTWFFENNRTTEDLRGTLRKVPDLDRALSRLSLERGGPRDVAAIRNGLEQAKDIQKQGLTEAPDLLVTNLIALSGHADLIQLLDEALVADPPLLARDGGFIATGFDDDLDDTRALRDEGRSVIATMQKNYAEIAGITSLKIKHNNVLGYFIETTAAHAEKMLAAPLNETFIHRQTTANQVRFTTVDLSEIETKILNAGNHALEIEKRHYQTLTTAILDKAAEISNTARALSEIDLNASLAALARAEDWSAPKVDNTRMFHVTGGRHPVVEQALRNQGSTPFIANSCDLSNDADGAAIWLLTGPNMAGKSTFLRQNALIAVLAQMGSYVPAQDAHIGIISQLFSRVGASDDLARGRSTFMVEMVETAAILNQADDRALVILDEIGRGTATYDGLSIAWATLEHLHDVNRSRALFATHYHELTNLTAKLDGAENATVSVREWEGDVIFLHEVIKGAADRSYGVQVAKLAGLPATVVERARIVLDALEKSEREGGGQKAVIDDLPLFSATPPPPPIRTKQSPAVDLLETIHPDELTPKEALDLIYKLKMASQT